VDAKRVTAASAASGVFSANIGQVALGIEFRQGVVGG